MTKIVKEVELEPFRVPNYAIVKAPPGNRGDDLVEIPKYPLKDLGQNVLAQLCDDFRRRVFQKANLIDPQQP